MGQNWFSFLSPGAGRAEQEREDQAFFQWAFPYGRAQQERVQRLLRELFPRVRPKLAMVVYLTAREAYRDREGLFTGHPAFDPVAAVFQRLEESGLPLSRADIPLYAALAAADGEVDEALAYPSREELLNRADQLSRQR